MLQGHEKQALTQAIAQMETKTSAELVVAITKASDDYQSAVLVGALVLGSLAELVAWQTKLLTHPALLLCLQLAVTLALTFIPAFRKMCIICAPKSVKHRRAMHHAYEEYLRVSNRLTVRKPIVLIYISLAEQYVHILTSRQVREQIPQSAWDGVVASFTRDIRSKGLGLMCENAVNQCAALLTKHFPDQGEPHEPMSHLVEE